MTQSRVRAAVIGLGRHGLRHLQACQLIDEIEVVAVCDQRAETVARVTDEHPGIKSYTAWKKLLEAEKLDLVSVVTNGPSHAPITIAAARAGVKHIMCEKPMATCPWDARKMIAVCREQGARVAVAHARRWVPAYRNLRESIASGAIGKLSHFWFTCGGGLFAGNGSHLMDLARMLSGSDPETVVGMLDRTGTPNPRGDQFLDPGAVALFQFKNGMRFVIDMFEDLGVPPRIEIVGSIGRILIDEIEGRWEISAREGENRSRPLAEYWLPLIPRVLEPVELDIVTMMKSGLAELISGGDLSCSGYDGLATLEMIIATHASSRNGGLKIDLPLTEEYQSIQIPIT